MFGNQPFWLALLLWGGGERLSFSERTRLCLTNAAGWAMLVTGVAFFVFNGISGRHHLLPLNTMLTATAVGGLLLARLGSRRSAFSLLAGGSAIVFVIGGYFFRNGLENFLMISLAATIFMIDSRWERWLLCMVYGAGFVVVKLSNHEMAAVAAGMRTAYVANLLVFVFWICGMFELFRWLTTDARRKAEATNQQLRESNRTKEELLSVISHDLRGPIGALLQSLEMLEAGLLSPEEFRKVIAQIREETGAVHQSLESLLIWAKRLLHEKPEILSVRLRPIVAETERLLALVARQKAISIQNRVREDTVVRGDAGHLQAIFRNLISNAIKFSPPGGAVGISAMPKGGDWLIEVSDGGVGMTPERMRQVIESPVADADSGTQAEIGTGVGLRLCREFLRDLNSDLHLESEPGIGTRAFFRLPAAPAIRPQPEPSR
ncbi:MAG: HAMP domain-containing sensor histidine kinase [Terrimicrobiaceae bacterium]|nr:HAMP domain-containing sensor histidine kinase [Terrimicrobiaceae bacterium]